MSAMVRGLKFIVITLAAYGRKVLLFILLFYCNAPAARRRYHVPRAASCRCRVPRTSVITLLNLIPRTTGFPVAKFRKRRSPRPYSAKMHYYITKPIARPAGFINNITMPRSVRRLRRAPLLLFEANRPRKTPNIVLGRGGVSPQPCSANKRYNTYQTNFRGQR